MRKHFRQHPAGIVAVAAMMIAALVAGVTYLPRVVSGEEAGKQPTASAGVDSAKSLSKAFRSVSHETMPSVVKIMSHTNAKMVSRGNGHNMRGPNPLQGTPFGDLFGDDGEGMMPNGRIPQRDGVGSGVIVDKSGIVLTNNHVVEGADQVTVRLADGREFKATDIKTDPQSDLAVLRIKADKDLPAAKLGNSDEMEIGDWVLAIGNPFELEMTVSAGIISGKGRELGSVRRAKFLQTDAAINPGNSGGPLVNLDGEVIGINTAIASNSGGYQGIGFAIPSNLAKWVMTQLIERGNVQRGYLGVNIEEVSPELADKLGVKHNAGVLVAEVMPKSPAGEAGIEEGDLITGFEGHAVKTPRDLQEIVERAPLNSKQKVEVVRDGKTQSLTVTIKALPDQAATIRPARAERNAESSDSYDAKELGLEVSDLTSATAQKLGFKTGDGVLITNVDEDSVAAHHGLQAGMLIRKVGQTPVKDLEGFKAAMKSQKLKDGILLQVRTENGNRFIVLHDSSSE